MRHVFTRTTLWLAVGLALFATACGGASAETAEIASIDDTTGATDNAGATTELSPDEAALAFSECLRSEGIDIPDIGVDADGNIDLRATFTESGIDLRGDDFTAARELCFPLIEGVAFGGAGGRAGLADNPEIEDAFLAYSDCLRDEGLDVGDLTLGQPGAGAGTPPADGEVPERGQGQGQGGFGDPNSRFATQLGLDPEDPEVAAALEVCGSIITDAFSAAGVEPRGAN